MGDDIIAAMALLPKSAGGSLLEVLAKLEANRANVPGWAADAVQQLLHVIEQGSPECATALCVLRGTETSEAVDWAAPPAKRRRAAVSYTHLTLPTILLV